MARLPTTAPLSHVRVEFLPGDRLISHDVIDALGAATRSATRSSYSRRPDAPHRMPESRVMPPHHERAASHAR